jgi:hypothetical protein
VDIYVESGTKRAFAGAVEWPGWCRSGRRGEDALERLFAYAPRYARVVMGAVHGFSSPNAPSDLQVMERLEGDATTDFGAPSVALAADARPLDERELSRLLAILEASWDAFDRVVESAEGRPLRKGPRGGGRELESIAEHVIGAESSYVGKLAAKRPKDGGTGWRAAAATERATVRDALMRAVTDGLPETGPRGGSIWLPRYFVRRAAWHVLDHAWEIDDRLDGEA